MLTAELRCEFTRFHSKEVNVMNEENIRKYAQLMKELDLTGLEVKEDDKVVRLERVSAQITAAPVTLANTPDVVPVSAEFTGAENDSYSVRSPMVGVFYAAPAENSEPYVKVGDSVKKGDTLCIVEAMKLMNEITAERDGIITEVCASNGQVVEYGSVLFKIGG